MASKGAKGSSGERASKAGTQAERETTPQPGVALVCDRAISPAEADVALCSIDAYGTGGVLNRLVLEALGYDPAQDLPTREQLSSGFTWLGSDGEAAEAASRADVLFIVTRQPEESTEDSLRFNLARALEAWAAELRGRTLWIPLMGTGAGWLPLADSLDLTVTALAEAFAAQDARGTKLLIALPPEAPDDEAAALQRRAAERAAAAFAAVRAGRRGDDDGADGAFDKPGYGADRVPGEGEAAVDQLGLHSEVEALCRVLVDRQVAPPISVGLLGDWGTGKSFFMKLMRDRIRGLEDDQRRARDGDGADNGMCGRVAQIRFNAWHFVDANLWANLVDTLFEGLAARMRPPDHDDPDRARRTLFEEIGKGEGTVAELTRATAEAEAAAEAAEQRFVAACEQLAFDGAMEDEVKGVLGTAAAALGWSGPWNSYLKIDDNIRELRSIHGRMRTLGHALGQDWNRRRTGIVVALLLIFFAGVVVIPWFFAHYEHGDAVAQMLATAAAPVAILLSWIAAYVARVTNKFGGLADKLEALKADYDTRLKAARDDHDDPQAVAWLEALEASRLAQAELEEAQDALDYQRERYAGLEPRRHLTKFIEDRSLSTDYKQRQGILALIRRDMEELSRRMRRWRRHELQGTAVDPVQTADGDGVDGDDAGGDGAGGERDGAPAVDRSAAADPDVRGTVDRSAAADPDAGEDDELAEPPPPELVPVDRIVLYVDDLDRCPPARVVEVLEALHLLLYFDLFVVVVAVDARWLLRSLEVVYDELLSPGGKNGQPTEQHGFARNTPQNYLEKIFQIPFALDRMSRGGFRTFVSEKARPRDADRPAARGATAASSATVASAATSPPAGGATAQAPGKDGVPDQAPQAAGQAAAPGAPAGGSGAAPADRPPARTLQLGDDEIARMHKLHPLIPSPRAALRMINVYRLLRAMVPDEEARWLAEPRGHDAALTLLGVLYGFPELARPLLGALVSPTRTPEQVRVGDEVSGASLYELVLPRRDRPDAGGEDGGEDGGENGGENGGGATAPLRNAIVGELTDDQARDWSRLAHALAAVDAPTDPADYRPWLRHVARFSFRTGQLWRTYGQQGELLADL